MAQTNIRANEVRWGSHGNDWPDGHRKCLKCNEIKSTTEFHKHKMCKGGFNSVCKKCRQPLSQENYGRHSTKYKLWYLAKRRAKERNIPFSIKVEDIKVPDVCPVFKTQFKENTIYAASLDRIDSNYGYVAGNIQVLSSRANMLKNDATVYELEQLIKFMKGICEIQM